MKYIKTLIVTIIFLITFQQYSNSQIIAPIGNSAKATSQLIFYYDNDEEGDSDDDGTIQVANTNDTEGVWIHVQIFRSFDPNEGNGTNDDVVICDERNFVDFLTPNDTHIYDFDIVNFPKNDGETATTVGGLTTISADGTVGYVVITPVVSDVDFTAISFQHMVGISHNDDEDYGINAMGRDALDFATGETLPDGTPLDGVNNGFLVIQPEELLFNVASDINDGDDNDVDLIGIAFFDSYGPPGLLGYTVTPGDVIWTPFIFDYRENPTSCGNRPVECFLNVGLTDQFGQDEEEFDDEGEIFICAGASFPTYPNIAIEFDEFGWGRIFVSGLEDFENHLGLLVNDDVDSVDWMFTRGERTDTGGPLENCMIAGDEDGDMLADCADPDCVGLAGPSGETCEAIEATCDDGFDNDGDGATDGADTDCDGSESCPSCESGDQCSDGEDNDGDGNSDCADGGCDGATGPNGETCEAGVELTCNDNQDNDGDGTADCDDPDCAIATNCIAGDGGGGGCSVAVTASPSMLNFLLPLIVVGLVVGIRRKRIN